MWLVKLAWKNLWRNRHRTFITMAAIFFAVILSVLATSLKEGIFNNLVKNVVRFYTGYIQIHQKGYWGEQILENTFATDVGLEQQLKANTGIASFTYRLESFALASTGATTKGCLVVGIVPDAEDRITSIRSRLHAGRFVQPNDRAVLLAAGLAQQLQMEPGDTIMLIGQGYHGATAAGKYPVAGLLQFGSPELNNRALYMPLALAQDFYAAYDRVTSCVIQLKNQQQLQAVASGLESLAGQGYEIMTWEQMMPDIKQHIQTDTENMKVVSGILYLLICFGIFGTLLMMMEERKFEMGMLVAVGMKKRLLVLTVVAESVLTVVMGCALGIVAAIPLVQYLHRRPIRIGGEMAKAYERFGFEAVFPTATDPYVFYSQALIVMLLGFLLALYPVYRVVRLNPVKAMRK